MYFRAFEVARTIFRGIWGTFQCNLECFTTCENTLRTPQNSLKLAAAFEPKAWCTAAPPHRVSEPERRRRWPCLASTFGGFRPNTSARQLPGHMFVRSFRVPRCSFDQIFEWSADCSGFVSATALRHMRADRQKFSPFFQIWTIIKVFKLDASSVRQRACVGDEGHEKRLSRLLLAAALTVEDVVVDERRRVDHLRDRAELALLLGHLLTWSVRAVGKPKAPQPHRSLGHG